jgi:hypothetical protein
LRPFRAGVSTPFSSTGLRPWLHSYAAPRLGCCDIKSFHAFLNAGYE